MIFRSLIAAVCIAVFASSGIAMQDLAIEPTETATDSDGLSVIDQANPHRTVRFNLKLTDESIQKLKENGELKSLIPNHLAAKISSIQIFHENYKEANRMPMPPLSLVSIASKGVITIQVGDEHLNRLPNEYIVSELDPKIPGPIKSVRLTYQNKNQNLARRRQLQQNFQDSNPRTPRPTFPQSRNRFSAPNSNVDRLTVFNAKLGGLSRELKAADSDSVKSILQDEIRELLESEYDRHLKKQQTKLDEMEQRLEKLRQQFNKQKDAKEKLVEMRMTSIVSDAEGINWPTEQSKNPSIRSSNAFDNWGERQLLERQLRLARQLRLERNPLQIQPSKVLNDKVFATQQTKSWLLGMSELAKTSNWEGLKRMGHIALTTTNSEGQQTEIGYKKNHELLAKVLEVAAQQKEYFNKANRNSWEVELDKKTYTLHIITTSKKYPAIGSILMSKPEPRLMEGITPLDGPVKIEFDKAGLLILKGDADSVKKTEKAIRDLMKQNEDQ